MLVLIYVKLAGHIFTINIVYLYIKIPGCWVPRKFSVLCWGLNLVKHEAILVM